LSTSREGLFATEFVSEERAAKSACRDSPAGRFSRYENENCSLSRRPARSLRFSVLLAWFGLRSTQGKTPWKITGQLEEACYCDAACPCWFDSKPTKMTCGGGQVLFIEKGNYGRLKLDGLAMANLVQSPEGQR